MMDWLMVYVLSRTFHIVRSMDYISVRYARFRPFARGLWSLGREGTLSCHTCCNTRFWSFGFRHLITRVTEEHYRIQIWEWAVSRKFSNALMWMNLWMLIFEGWIFETNWEYTDRCQWEILNVSMIYDFIHFKFWTHKESQNFNKVTMKRQISWLTLELRENNST